MKWSIQRMAMKTGKRISRCPGWSENMRTACADFAGTLVCCFAHDAPSYSELEPSENPVRFKAGSGAIRRGVAGNIAALHRIVDRDHLTSEFLRDFASRSRWRNVLRCAGFQPLQYGRPAVANSNFRRSVSNGRNLAPRVRRRRSKSL